MRQSNARTKQNKKNSVKSFLIRESATSHFSVNCIKIPKGLLILKCMPARLNLWSESINRKSTEYLHCSTAVYSYNFKKIFKKWIEIDIRVNEVCLINLYIINYLISQLWGLSVSCRNFDAGNQPKHCLERCDAHQAFTKMIRFVNVIVVFL